MTLGDKPNLNIKDDEYCPDCGARYEEYRHTKLCPNCHTEPPSYRF